MREEERLLREIPLLLLLLLLRERERERERVVPSKCYFGRLRMFHGLLCCSEQLFSYEHDSFRWQWEVFPAVSAVDSVMGKTCTQRGCASKLQIPLSCSQSCVLLFCTAVRTPNLEKRSLAKKDCMGTGPLFTEMPICRNSGNDSTYL